MTSIIIEWILQIILFSGPIVPMIFSAAMFGKEAKYKMLLRISLFFHIIGFQPFLLGLIDKNPDSQFWYYLIVPMATGFMTLQIGIITFILNLRNKRNSNQLIDPTWTTPDFEGKA